MKLSVSLPDEDVAFLDAYSDENGIPSRSAVLQKAVRLLRSTELAAAYDTAWAEWEESDGPIWDAVSEEGLGG